jgi:hypothetical protein
MNSPHQDLLNQIRKLDAKATELLLKEAVSG